MLSRQWGIQPIPLSTDTHRSFGNFSARSLITKLMMKISLSPKSCAAAGSGSGGRSSWAVSQRTLRPFGFDMSS